MGTECDRKYCCRGSVLRCNGYLFCTERIRHSWYLMTVLARYAGEDTTGGATWYEKGMNWAKAKGVSDGTNPNANITREQLVTMLYRYAGSLKADGKLDSFSDSASVSSYAADAMQWAVANGIVNGSNGKLNPQNNATRAQVAAILMRFCEMSK